MHLKFGGKCACMLGFLLIRIEHNIFRFNEVLQMTAVCDLLE